MVPFVRKFKPQSVLTAGETARDCLENMQDTRLLHLATPFSQQQLDSLAQIDLAVISHLVESLSLSEAQQWLGTVRNLYAPHIILITEPELARQRGWQLANFLAMGLTHIAGSNEGLQLYSYAIENYQPKRDWLNSRFWANPENYDKYRW